LESSIIIFDEAHNLEKICEDCFSLELKGSDISNSVEELTEFAKFTKISNESKSFSQKSQNGNRGGENDKLAMSWKDILSLKGLVLRFESMIFEILIPNKQEYITKNASTLYDMALQCNFVSDEESYNMKILDECIKHFNSDSNKTHYKGFGCEKVRNFIEFFSIHGISKLDDYIACIQDTNVKDSRIKDRQINLWCLNPAAAINSLTKTGVRTMIFASGTLSPIKDYIYSLGLVNPVIVQNSHIIQNSQLACCLVSKGPRNEILSSQYNNRKNTNYLNSIFQSLVILSQIVPKGVLVFFPSFRFMEETIEHGYSYRFMATILKRKKIFIEPKSKTDFQDIIKSYFDCCENEPCGGMMFAVCRAKISEGIDFADDKCRAVIIIGIPYPYSLDPKIKAKMAYIDNKFKQMQANQNDYMMNSNSWYTNQALKTVNQAIGRVIRHSKDYGMIFLMDERFIQKQNIDNLPGWINKVSTKCTQFSSTLKVAKTFFSVEQGNKLINDTHSLVETETKSKINSSDTSDLQFYEDTLKPQIRSEPSNRIEVKRKILVHGNRDLDAAKKKSTDNQEKIKLFRSLAKSMLSREEYDSLAQSLREYRATKNFETLTSSLEKIVKVDPKRIVIVKSNIQKLFLLL
ncbi:MAG: Regulator of telomere elongation helicase 1, partial [Paramarteilia canceri]